MSSLSLVLVLSSAFLHAWWNFIAKRAKGGALFVWYLGVFENIIFLPIVLYEFSRLESPLGWQAIAWMFGSGCIHIAYFLLLTTAYRVGDLSVVYPLARALGPLLATIAAIAFFAERPSLLALSGTGLICMGVVWLTGKPRHLIERQALQGVLYAALTGVAIAAYTLWDKQAISTILIPPVLFQAGNSFFRLLVLTPYALHKREETVQMMRRDWQPALWVAILGWLSYWLILVAFETEAVSYVAPLRVVSTLIGVVMGTRLLGEGDELRRVGAAMLIVTGVFALAIG